MGFNDRLIYMRPTKLELDASKGPILANTTCPQCGGHDVRRYPVGWYKGPRMVVKCQDCYHTLEVQIPGPEDAWPPFRASAYDWEASPAERALVPNRSQN